MTTKITLTYGGAELVVTGEYWPAGAATYMTISGSEHQGRADSDFVIERIEQDGHDVTEHYRRMRLIPLLEDMAREVVESN